MAKIILYTFSFCICFCFSCATTRVDKSVLDHQRRVTELEERNAYLEARIRVFEDTIANTISGLESLTADAEAIGTKATSISERVDYVIRLFDEYQRTIEQLLKYNRQADSENKNTE